MDRKRNKKIVLPKLSVVGLGKLGVCTAACFASKGYKVVGCDIDQKTVDLINQGKAPVVEPRLQEFIDKSKKNLKATTDLKEVIKNSDVTFLIVPTPSKKDHSFSDGYLKTALKPLTQDLKNKKAYHLFVIVSTVSPGTIEKKLIPLIEKYSAKKLNKDFGVCYNPEFIALGDVINGVLKPDMVLIGESNEFAGEQIEKIYKKVCENKPYVARMSIVSAEIAKIALNAYITMKISFANTLANISEKIAKANIDAITKALGADKRISPYYLKGGLAYGGPCFPRDGKAFLAFAKGWGIEAKLAKATDEINQFQEKHLVDKVLTHLLKTKKKSVSILGLTYKPDTPVIEESPAIKIIQLLLEKNIKITVYDPLAMENAKKIFGNKIYYASSPKECFVKSAFCIIATQAKEFKKIDESYIIHNPTTIFDCWRIIDVSRLGKKVKYVGLGRFSL